MKQKYPIDTAWFLSELERNNLSQSDLARFFGRDKSAISRMLKGERNMSAEDQDKIAVFLKVELDEVAAHRGGAQSGFGERKQSEYLSEGSANNRDAADRKGGKDPYRHPIFGCMAGTLTVAPGIDLTEPMDFEWGGELYNE